MINLNNLTENIDMFITDLLHINDGGKNKLIDLEAGDPSKTYYLNREDRESISRYILGVIRARIGKPGNTALLRSSLTPEKEQHVGRDINAVDWVDGKQGHDSKLLHKFIEGVYKELNLKGNNPLFLSVGALHWEVEIRTGIFKKVHSPLIIFPIRLVRTDSSNTPVYIEFINDDIYLNPCLIAKLRQVWGESGESILRDFPHPNGAGVSVDDPIELDQLGNGEDYLDAVTSYIRAQRRSEDTTFEFLSDVVAIAQYNHDELCMYYDIKRHKEEIYSSPLVERIFTPHETFQPSPAITRDPQCILPRDSVQERMISRVVNGESLIIKGPPGAGKTLTITNMIAALLAANKKVILSSQKPAAMFEVFAKLPEPLRKFVMLLDCETETQAAKLNPADVRREFNDLLERVRTFRHNDSVHDDIISGNAERAAAAKQLTAYTEQMFNTKDIIGYSYYEALDILCKIDAPHVQFAEPELAYLLTRTEYHALEASVSEAAEHFERISNGHTVEKSPWLPYMGTLNGVNFEAALAAYGKIAMEAKVLVDAFAKLFEQLEIKGEGLQMGATMCLLENLITKEHVAAITDPVNAALVKKIREAYVAYLNTQGETANAVEIVQDENGMLAYATTGHEEWDKGLTIDAFKEMYADFAVLQLLGDPIKLPLLINFVKQVEDLTAKIRECEEQFYTVFREDLLDDEKRSLIREAYESFSTYDVSKQPKAPRLLDMKGKKLYAQLQTLGYGATISFVDAIGAVIQAHEIDQLKGQIEEEKVALSAKFRHKFSEKQFDLLFALMQRSVQCKSTVQVYVQNMTKYKDTVYAALSSVKYNEGATLGDLCGAVRVYVALQDLQMALNLLQNQSEAFTATELEKPARCAEIVGAVQDIAESGVLGRGPAEIATNADKLYKNGQRYAQMIHSLQKALVGFGNTFFRGYYTRRHTKATFGDLRIFCAEAVDRSIVHAANEYLNILHTPGKLALENFFRPFENGRRVLGKYTFTQHFEHSVFYLAVQAKLALLGNYRYGLGSHVTRELAEWEEGDNKVSRASLTLVEQQCIGRINPADPEFAFLSAERANNDTLRKMFKKHTKEILKLKKCFILSPSTVSVFFGRPEFSDFDVVIVDEASQLEPTAILPVLFRTKQVVLVGDEWQMPPIKHFSTHTEHRVVDEDGETMYMNPDTSVLSLALTNCAFPNEKLACHYRSRTESLISFSQGLFYDYMRTFPTPVPKAPGLGFKDVYLPEGYCDNAVNHAEAEAVVEELKLHFDTYFKDGVLTESVGVVAFGEKQVEYIRALVRNNKDLEEKIKTAVANFNDLEEKLIFFKTIETVQGQETDHLILSLTYGKSKDGKLVQAFGELNRGQGNNKLGQCIFNVAVTRAKSSVTMIHSVTAEEITNKSVEFLSKYLEVVRRFSADGRSQFVGEEVEKTKPGFLRQVAEFIVSCGIDASRVVLNFGATQGSIRIPIAILNPDKSEAMLGIWCETDPGNTYDYLDYNLRYFRILQGTDRHWQLHRLYIHDWVDNNEAEKNTLREIVSRCK